MHTCNILRYEKYKKPEGHSQCQQYSMLLIKHEFARPISLAYPRAGWMTKLKLIPGPYNKNCTWTPKLDKTGVNLEKKSRHDYYDDVIMDTRASQITSLTIVYSTVYSGANQRKHQSSASVAFVRGIHRGPVNSPHKWPVTRKIFPFDDVIMIVLNHRGRASHICVSKSGHHWFR